MFTKTTFSRALFSVDVGMVNTQVLLSLDLQGLSVTAQIDGVPPSPSRLSAYSTVAQIERDRIGRLKLKLDRATMAGTFK
jgi:hypothetical protein